MSAIEVSSIPVIPVALRKAFRHDGNQVVIQIVDKVHKSGRKDNRVLVVRNLGPQFDMAMLFLCTFGGVVRRVIRLSSITKISIVDVCYLCFRVLRLMPFLFF